MSIAVRDLRRAAWEGSEAAAVAIAGIALLLLRAVVKGPSAPWFVLGMFAALLALSLSVTVPAEAPAPLGRAVVWGAGLAAVALASVVAGPRVPVQAGPALLGLNVVAAISEEAFFRRFLYGRLVGFGVPAAILGSALLFALVHVPAYGWIAFPVDLGAGLVLSWQRWASGSWTVPAATHAVANLLAVFR